MCPESSRLVRRSQEGEGGRDSMKVAQYEVLGWRSKKGTRPGRDDRGLLTLVKLHTREPGARTLLSSLPGRTSFLHYFPALRTGLLSLSPFLLRPPGYGAQAGTNPLRMLLSLLLKQMHGRGDAVGQESIPPRK